MESSVRIFSNSKTNLKHHFFSHSSFLHPKHSSLKFPPRITLLKTSFHINTPTHYSPLTFLLSLSTTHFKGLDSDPKETFFSWNQAPVTVNNGNVAVFKEKRSVLAVVMLGWLGAEEKHLKRYIELYADKGIHAVSFVVPVKDVWGFDLGKKVERRIEALGEEIVRWLSEKEDDGRERGLMFHTFSNTGWLA
ncbi:hypothetical protein IFM89_017700 [Coptis chinensis]|uniref:Uncharacterized protein n=1 Tax=Coptis chinensis TaxID=261450 RepID=A0A835HZ46_9MAGN|nr:hypothetical protein IFM89_017700 [Coptis chinensis]